MALQGELKNMPLSDILQSLKANHQSGTLNIKDGQKKFALFFKKDVIICVNPGRPSSEYFMPIVCQFLNITQATIDREFKNKSKLSIADRLNKIESDSTSKINPLHCIYLTEFLYDVFSWHSGSFRFEEGPISEQVFDEDQRNAGLKLDIDQVIFESMRRADEWKIIAKNIPTMHDVFTITDEFQSQVEQLTEPVKSIVELCNGEHNVREIAYRLGQDLFTTASVLNNALQQHMVRRIASNDLIVLAEHCFSNNRSDDALRYFKRAIELDRGNIDVRMRFADMCANQGIISEATNEFKTLAQLTREKQEFEKAKRLYRKIIELNPSEYEFQKRLYEMLREIKDPEARTTGLELIDTLKRLGLRREEGLVLRQLIEDNDVDVYFYERLGDAEQSLGHDKNAIENYLAAAEICIKNDDQQKACTNYENILAINPDDVKIKKLLDELQSGIYHKKRRQRKRVILISEIGAVIVLICSYLAYCAFSVIDYVEIRNQNILNLVNGDFSAIEANINNFKKKHPFSLVNLDLKRYQEVIDKLVSIRRSDSSDNRLTAPYERNQKKSVIDTTKSLENTISPNTTVSSKLSPTDTLQGKDTTANKVYSSDSRVTEDTSVVQNK